MEQSKKWEIEQRKFLTLCSPHDRDMLTGKADMSLQDFERITYLTMSLDYGAYTEYLHKCHLDFTVELSQQIDREHEILDIYPSYFEDEQIQEKYKHWIEDFLNQLPVDKKSYYQRKIQKNTLYL